MSPKWWLGGEAQQKAVSWRTGASVAQGAPPKAAQAPAWENYFCRCCEFWEPVAEPAWGFCMYPFHIAKAIEYLHLDLSQGTPTQLVCSELYSLSSLKSYLFSVSWNVVILSWLSVSLASSLFPCWLSSYLPASVFYGVSLFSSSLQSLLFFPSG